MSHIKFWEGWNKGYKGIYIMLLIVFVIFLAGFLVLQYVGADIAIPLETVRKTQSIELTLHNISDFVFELGVPTRNYVIFQGFLALETGFMPMAGYILLAIVFLSFSFLLAASTYFSRIWFIIFQSIIVIWIITLKLQYLHLLGMNNQIFTYLFIGVFLIVGYIFHAFKTDLSLFKRWISFSSLLIVLLLLVHFGSDVKCPVLFMAQHGIIVPIILSIVFIFNVAYEVVLHILYLLASKKNEEGGSNLGHFLILSVLYLGYVSLTYAKNDYLINWDIIYLDEFLLLGISAVLGVWGFKKRNELIAKQLPFRPLGGYLYLVFGILTFSTIAWVFITNNDPFIDTFEDMIIFSHLGFGVIFLIYVIYNFLGLLKAGHGIYPVVFRPVSVPYNLVRLLGIGVVFLLVLKVSYLPYNQAIAGYYNALGDYYEQIENQEAANTTYKIARQYSVTNHKSNFKIGQISYANKNWVEASNYFKQANRRRPTVQSFVNRVQTLINASLYFDAFFVAEEAQLIFPDNAYIQNMTGLVYEQINKIDSSFIYFDAAIRSGKGKKIKQVAEANKLALFAKNGIDEDLPDWEKVANSSVPLKANYYALANKKRVINNQFELNSSNYSPYLTYNDFSFLYNYSMNKTLNHEEMQDDSLSWLNSFVENEPFNKSINFAIANRKNYSGDIKSAYSYVYELENADISDAGFYFLTHGLWLYEQGAYNLAVEKFQKAEQLKMSKAITFKIIALIRAGRLFEAARAFEAQFNEDLVDSNILSQDPLFQFLKGNVEELPENFLYLWLQTNASIQPAQKDSILNKLNNSPFLKLRQLDNVQELITFNENEQALEKLTKIKIDKDEIALKIYENNLNAFLVAKLNKRGSVSEVDMEKLSIYPRNYKLLFEAYKATLDQDSVYTDKLMWELGNQNMFFEESVIFASNYFNERNKKDKAYEILVEAVRLNENSVRLLKSYILQAAQLNLVSYAEDSLSELAILMNESSFEKFKILYEKIKVEVASKPW